MRNLRDDDRSRCRFDKKSTTNRRAHVVPQYARRHVDSCPYAALGGMLPREARRQRCLVELAGSAVWREIVRPLHPIAARAIEFDAEHLVAGFLADNPRSVDEWRSMAHVLGVAAIEIGHPVALFITTKPQDRALHDEPAVAHLLSTALASIMKSSFMQATRHGAIR